MQEVCPGQGLSGQTLAPLLRAVVSAAPLPTPPRSGDYSPITPRHRGPSGRPKPSLLEGSSAPVGGIRVNGTAAAGLGHRCPQAERHGLPVKPRLSGCMNTLRLPGMPVGQPCCRGCSLPALCTGCGAGRSQEPPCWSRWLRGAFWGGCKWEAAGFARGALETPTPCRLGARGRERLSRCEE